MKIKKETENLWQSSASVQQEALTAVEFLKHLLLFTHLLHPPPSVSRERHLFIYYIYSAKAISHDSHQGFNDQCVSCFDLHVNDIAGSDKKRAIYKVTGCKTV